MARTKHHTCFITALALFAAGTAFASIHVGLNFNGNPSGGYIANIITRPDSTTYEIRQVVEPYVGVGTEFLVDLGRYFQLRLLPVEVRFENLYGTVVALNNSLDGLVRIPIRRFTPYLFGGIQLNLSSKVGPEGFARFGMGAEFALFPRLNLFAETQLMGAETSIPEFYYNEGDTQPYATGNSAAIGQAIGRYSIGMRFAIN